MASPTSIDRLIGFDARNMLRATIAEYDGSEVFFVGRTDADGVVIDVEACAFGNENAVPVIEHMARPGNIVIHNHPGDDLRPSQPDIEIASRFGNIGVGSYIIDNAAQQVRIIVPAMTPKERKPLNIAALEKALSPDGTLARCMPQYEHRPQQTQMLRVVADAFNGDGIAVIEAGTGTGKSLAYLLPAIHWSKTNGEPVVISTNTINLQEQLILKDIPFLRKHLGLEFEAVLLKGRSNYLCRRKAEYNKRTPDFFADEQTVTQLESILAWAEKTANGSLSDLSFIPDDDVWEQVAVDADNCTRIRCPHYAKCFFYESRRQAARADIIVANHHLVMADVALRRETGNYTSVAVLPAYHRVVFDEAHNLEEVATQYFGIKITRRTMTHLLSRLVHRDRSNIGLLPFLHGHLAMLAFRCASPLIQPAMRLISDKLIPLKQELGRALNELMDLCAEGVGEALGEELRPRRELQLRIVPNVEQSIFWAQSLRRAIDAITDQMGELAKGLLQVHGDLMKLPKEVREDIDTPAGELKSLANKLNEKATQFRNFYTIGEDRCRWIEVYKSAANMNPQVRLNSLPLEVQEALNQAVYAVTQTVVMTSATLTVDRRFDFFLGQAGLSGEHSQIVADRVATLELDTPFDYERQAFVGVPLDMPDPKDRQFTESATEFLLPVLQVSQGSAFILFTSYSQLNLFYDRMSPVLRSLGYSCLKQGMENRHVLLRRFKNDRTSILFATSSFWEGVDVPGDALRLLVLAKLPFRVPTDPLLQARVEMLDRMGADSFTDYVVPQAVIKFKQGFGRLIRTRDDVGGVIILDRRVVTKGYGETFLNSLPAGTIHREDGLTLLNQLRDFFSSSAR